MKLLDRYIGRTVAVHTAVVTAVLMSVYFFTTFVAEMDYVGQGSYTMLGAVSYSLLLMPRLAYEVFPMAALIGSMLGLGAMASSSELTVMRAAGVSIRRLTWSVLKVGMLMVVLVVLLGEVVAPPAEKYARMQRGKALAQELTVNTDYGLWAREGDTFINIRRLLPNNRLSGINLYRFDGERMVEAVQAKSAIFRQGHWMLEDVQQSRFQDGEVATRKLPDHQWKTTLTPEMFDVVSVPPENLSIWDLDAYVNYLEDNGLDSSRYRLSLWIRIVSPFSAAGMVLLAVPFVFGSLRSVGVGARIMVGALLGVGFYLFNGVFSQMGLVYGLPPMLSAMTPTIMVFGLWAWLMRRTY